VDGVEAGRHTEIHGTAAIAGVQQNAGGTGAGVYGETRGRGAAGVFISRGQGSAGHFEGDVRVTGALRVAVDIILDGADCADLQARPVYHRKRDSIEAHLTIVFAALAVSRWIEAQTGWSIRKFVRTARRYRTIEIQAGRQTITAADPLPDDLRQALEAITRSSRGAH
jgi:hypothetical protein